MSSSTMESESPVNSFSESATKRKREEFTTSESESDTSDAAETEVLSQRLVLIEVTTLIQKERRTRQGVVHEKQERDILMFLPEHIVHQIPKYAASFEEIGVADHVDGDIAFDDDDTHDHRAFVQTMDFVGGASLRPLAGSTESIKETLKDLLGMYVVAVSLKIETLQVAILEHIESCPDMPIDIFLEFAKSFYDGCEPDDSKQNAIESPIGKLIKRKLEILLPQLLQDGTAQRIKAGGGTLSTQLLEVMIEQFSGKGGIKIEE